MRKNPKCLWNSLQQFELWTTLKWWVNKQTALTPWGLGIFGDWVIVWFISPFTLVKLLTVSGQLGAGCVDGGFMGLLHHFREAPSGEWLHKCKSFYWVMSSTGLHNIRFTVLNVEIKAILISSFVSQANVNNQFPRTQFWLNPKSFPHKGKERKESR